MWNRPRGYKGLRTNYRHAFRIHIRKLSDVRASHKSIYDQQTIMEEWCEEIVNIIGQVTIIVNGGLTRPKKLLCSK